MLLANFPQNVCLCWNWRCQKSAWKLTNVFVTASEMLMPDKELDGLRAVSAKTGNCVPLKKKKS